MKRKLLLLVGRTVVSVSLIGFLLFNLGKENIQELPSYLEGACYVFLLFSVLSVFAVVACCAVRWKRLLDVQGIEFSFFSILKLTFIGVFFSNFLPGLVGGDAVKLFYTTQKTRKTAGILASILLDRVLGVSALLVIVVLVLPFSFNVPAVKENYPFVLVLFTLFWVAVFLFFNLKSSSVLRRLYKIGVFDLGNKVKRFKDSLVIYRKSKSVFVYTFFVSLVIQFLIIFFSYFVSRFLNLNIPVKYFFLFFPIIQLITFIPITVSGIGMREWAFIFFFATASGVITKMDAFALSITFYFVNLMSSVPGGIAYFLMGGEMKNLTEDTRP